MNDFDIFGLQTENYFTVNKGMCNMSLAGNQC